MWYCGTTFTLKDECWKHCYTDSIHLTSVHRTFFPWQVCQTAFVPLSSVHRTFFPSTSVPCQVCTPVLLQCWSCSVSTLSLSSMRTIGNCAVISVIELDIVFSLHSQLGFFYTMRLFLCTDFIHGFPLPLHQINKQMEML